MSDAEPTLNPFRARLHRGEPAIGMLVTVPAVGVVQALARLDVDWLFIDLEHGPIDMASLHAMIAATQGTATAPIVRVPWNEHWLAKQVLDAGAMGVVFPTIRSAEEAAAAASAVRYPPAGVRGYSPIYGALRFGTPLPGHIDVADREIVCNVLVEHRDAVERIEEIARVPGVDVLQIAPFDLAMSYGHRDQLDHPEVLDAIAHAEAVIRESPAALGGLATEPRAARDMIERGYSVILGGIDVQLLHGAAGSYVEQVRGGGS